MVELANSVVAIRKESGQWYALVEDTHTEEFLKALSAYSVADNMTGRIYRSQSEKKLYESTKEYTSRKWRTITKEMAKSIRNNALSSGLVTQDALNKALERVTVLKEDNLQRINRHLTPRPVMYYLEIN